MATLENILASLRRIETGSYEGDYRSHNPFTSASGAYQYVLDTWHGYGGYFSANLAPKNIQDKKASIDVSHLLQRFQGDVRMVAAAWYVGEGKAAQIGSESSYTPPGKGHPLSVKEYVDKWQRFYNAISNGLMPPSATRKNVSGSITGEQIGATNALPTFPALSRFFILGVGFFLIVLAVLNLGGK